MTDVHNTWIRSYNMSQIKGKNTKPEILVRKFLFANGYRYRLHDKNFPGKPDIVLAKYMTVIFVNGCFWHGHQDCSKFVIPNTRREFWLNKITKNILNDKKNRLSLEQQGWKVLTVWECQLKKDKSIDYILKQIRS